MEQKRFHRIAIKWFVLITLFSLSIFVERLYAFRVYTYNTHPVTVRLEVFNGHHCKCLTKVLEAQSPSFIDVGPVLTICNEPINKIDVYDHQTNRYMGTIQGKNILYNPDIII